MRGSGPPDAAGATPLRLVGSAEGAAFALDARPVKPLVLQGDRGLSQKGVEAGNASYYYAQTRMATTGTVTLPGRDGVPGEAVPVEGLTWLDREWSTSALGRRADGLGLVRAPPRRRPRPDAVPAPSATAEGPARSEGSLVARDGTKTRLLAADFTLAPAASWRAPDGARLPDALARPRPVGEGIDVDGRRPPSRRPSSTRRVRYWEGAVDVAGSATGTGFLEMTGYADMRDRRPDRVRVGVALTGPAGPDRLRIRASSALGAVVDGRVRARRPDPARSKEVQRSRDERDGHEDGQHEPAEPQADVERESDERRSERSDTAMGRRRGAGYDAASAASCARSQHTCGRPARGRARRRPRARRPTSPER